MIDTVRSLTDGDARKDFHDGHNNLLGEPEER